MFGEANHFRKLRDKHKIRSFPKKIVIFVKIINYSNEAKQTN